MAAVAAKASRGHFRAWLSFADDALPGRYQLLGCSAGAPSRRACFVLGRITLASAPAAIAATPSLDTGHAVTRLLVNNTTSLSTTGADGTRYTLTVPPSDLDFPVTLTPVTSLAPSSAVGKLVAGVMITPIGDAPPGAQLTISPARKPGFTARLVAFGGADPAGAAFDLPIAFGKSATIPVMQFGGYGIVTPPAGGAGDAPLACGPALARPAAAGSRPIVSCSSAAQRIRQLSDSLAKDIARERQEELAGKTADPAIQKDIADAQQAGIKAINQEAARVFMQPPSDEGDAELGVLTELMLGVGRQEELTGSELPGGVLAALANVVDYRLKNIRRACTGPESSSSLLAHAAQVFGLVRQAELLGVNEAVDAALQLRAKCLLRVRVKLDVSNHTTVQGGANFDGQDVKVSAEVLVAGQKDPDVYGGVALHADNKNLTYDSATVSPNPQYMNIFTTTYTDKSGYIQVGNVAFTAVTHTRCDKNRKFVVDRDVKLWLTTGGEAGLWHDTQSIDVKENGSDLGNHAETAVSAVWGIGLSGGFIEDPMSIALVVPPTETKPKAEASHSGACPNAACGTYTYDATFDATDLPGAAAADIRRYRDRRSPGLPRGAPEVNEG